MIRDSNEPGELLAELRAKGWMVAVHNDYRLDGEAHTFYLLTHPNGYWIKGEGNSDAEALQEAMACPRFSTAPGEQIETPQRKPLKRAPRFTNLPKNEIDKVVSAMRTSLEANAAKLPLMDNNTLLNWFMHWSKGAFNTEDTAIRKIYVAIVALASDELMRRMEANSKG